MKYLVIIFSLYMTVLTLMPCQDKEDISKSSEQTHAVQKPSNGVEHHGQETCPPFCSCACCSVSKYFPLKKEQVEIVKTITISYLLYLMPAIADLPIEIYQPPKIA